MNKCSNNSRLKAYNLLLQKSERTLSNIRRNKSSASLLLNPTTSSFLLSHSGSITTPRTVLSPVKHLSSSSTPFHMSTTFSYESKNNNFTEQLKQQEEETQQQQQQQSQKLTCPYCGKGFSHERTLTEHRRTRHAELEQAKIKERSKVQLFSAHELEQKQQQRNVYLYDLLRHQEHLTQHQRQSNLQKATHALQNKLTSKDHTTQPRAFTHSMLVNENAQLSKEIHVLEKEYEQMKERIASLRTRLANPVFSINSTNNNNKQNVTLPLFHAAIPSMKPLPITRDELVLLQKYTHHHATHALLECSPEKDVNGQCKQKLSKKVKVNSTYDARTNTSKTNKDNSDAKNCKDSIGVDIVATGTGISQWTGIGVVRGVVRLGYLHGSALHNINLANTFAKLSNKENKQSNNNFLIKNSNYEKKREEEEEEEQCRDVTTVQKHHDDNANVVQMPEILQFTLETHGYRNTRPGQQRLFRNRVRVRYFYNTKSSKGGEEVFVVKEGDLICVQGHYARHLSYDVVSKQQRENVVVEADVIGMLHPYSE